MLLLLASWLTPLGQCKKIRRWSELALGCCCRSSPDVVLQAIVCLNSYARCWQYVGCTPWPSEVLAASWSGHKEPDSHLAAGAVARLSSLGILNSRHQQLMHLLQFEHFFQEMDPPSYYSGRPAAVLSDCCAFGPAQRLHHLQEIPGDRQPRLHSIAPS